MRSNNDELLLRAPADLPSHKQALGAWLAQQLPRSERKRLATLPLTAALAEGEVLASHGTPTTPWDSLLLHFDCGTRLFRRRSADEIGERLQGYGGHRVYLVGHMHRADTRRLGDALLVNAGPVNWQNDGDPRAAWTLLERRGGTWHVEHRRVEYDCAAAANFIRRSVQLSQAPDEGEIDLILSPAKDPWA